MPIKFPAGSEPERRRSSQYASPEWGDRLVALIKHWNESGREDRFVPSHANGLSASTLRAAFYTARSYINNPAHGYDEATIELVNGVRFIMTDHPSEGLILRSATPPTLMSAPAKPPDAESDTYQEIVAWCGAPHTSGEFREWTGMFSIPLRQRIDGFMRQLVGAYLARITPTSIKIIAWEDGAASMAAPAPVQDNTPQPGDF